MPRPGAVHRVGEALLDARQVGDEIPVEAPGVGAHGLEDQRVRGGKGQVQVGAQRDRAGAVVGCDRPVEGFGQRRHLAALGQAADPGHVEMDDVDRTPAQGFLEPDRGAEVLAARDPAAHARLVAREVVQLVHRNRVLVPVDPEPAQRIGDLERRRELPEPVVFEHDVDPVADRTADRLDQRDRAREIPGRDVLAAGRQRVGIERPDLHGRDPVLEQGGREFRRAMVLGCEIVEQIGAGRGIARAHQERIVVAARDPVVGGAGAGVVDPDFFPAEAAEQLVDRQAGRLAEQVPEGEIDRGIAPHLDAASGKTRKMVTDLGHQRAGVALDPERVFPQKVRRAGLVDVGDRRLGIAEGLAETPEALVGLKLDPDEVAELGELDGLECGDLHLVASPGLPAGFKMIAAGPGAHKGSKRRPTPSAKETFSRIYLFSG